MLNVVNNYVGCCTTSSVPLPPFYGTLFPCIRVYFTISIYCRSFISSVCFYRTLFPCRVLWNKFLFFQLYVTLILFSESYFLLVEFNSEAYQFKLIDVQTFLYCFIFSKSSSRLFLFIALEIIPFDLNILIQFIAYCYEHHQIRYFVQYRHHW